MSGTYTLIATIAGLTSSRRREVAARVAELRERSDHGDVAAILAAVEALLVEGSQSGTVHMHVSPPIGFGHVHP